MKDIGRLGEKDERYESSGEKPPGVFLFPQFALKSDTFPRYRIFFFRMLYGTGQAKHKPRSNTIMV